MKLSAFCAMLVSVMVFVFWGYMIILKFMFYHVRENNRMVVVKSCKNK